MPDVALWDAAYAEQSSRTEPDRGERRILGQAQQWLGSVAGKRLLDLGCGTGFSSL